MMKVLYTTRDGKLTFELEGQSQAELFEKLAQTQEIFEDRTCTKHGEESDEVNFVVREVDGNKFYELQYVGNNQKLWGCKRTFGQSKQNKGQLFPHRKDKEGRYLPDNGWVVYDKETGELS